MRGNTIFEHLCDAALLEEARARLGKEAAMRLINAASNQFYVYRTKLAKGDRMSAQNRATLVSALTETVTPEEVLRVVIEVRRLQPKIDEALEMFRPPSGEVARR